MRYLVSYTFKQIKWGTYRFFKIRLGAYNDWIFWGIQIWYLIGIFIIFIMYASIFYQKEIVPYRKNHFYIRIIFGALLIISVAYPFSPSSHIFFPLLPAPNHQIKLNRETEQKFANYFYNLLFAFLLCSIFHLFFSLLVPVALSG